MRFYIFVLSFLLLSVNAKSQEWDVYAVLTPNKSIGLFSEPGKKSDAGFVMKDKFLIAASLEKGVEQGDTGYYWYVLTPSGKWAYALHEPEVFYEAVPVGAYDSFKVKGKKGRAGRVSYVETYASRIREKKEEDFPKEKARWERAKFYADSVKRARAEQEAMPELTEEEKKQRNAAVAKRVSELRKEIEETAGKYGIVVSAWNWKYPTKYSYAVDVTLSVINPTRKKIKYVWFTVAAYDAVGGRLSSFGETSVTVKGIGPIEPFETAAYEFENVFTSKVIDRMEIRSVKVQYFDGTNKTIYAGSPAIAD